MLLVDLELLLDEVDAPPRVDREKTGTSSNGGVDVAWKACDIMH